MTAQVSVVIPVCNGERFVREAIESVLTQTVPALEIIVIDDGSTDGTVPAVSACRVPELRCVSQPNAGPPAARNHGVRLARGEFVAFLDADDVWETRKLEQQLAHFARNPSLDCSLTRARLVWDEDVRAEDARGRPTSPVETGGVCWSAMLVRRSVLDRVGPFNAALKHADAADWFGRARGLGVQVESLDAVLLRRRLHAANFSRTDHAGTRDEWLSLAAKALQLRRKGRDGRSG